MTKFQLPSFSVGMASGSKDYDERWEKTFGRVQKRIKDAQNRVEATLTPAEKKVLAQRKKDQKVVERSPKVIWNRDPAASGPRWRAFLAGWELIVYETGAWFVSRDGSPFTSGKSTSLAAGKRAALRVWRK